MSPTPGITHQCEIVRVLDGDTLEVSITTTAIVRLLDCWAPEVHRTDDPGEKPRGLVSKAHLQSLAKPGDKVIVQVPFSDRGRFGDDMTMGRVLGNVWLVGNDKSLSQLQVEAGQATVTKAQ